MMTFQLPRRRQRRLLRERTPAAAGALVASVAPYIQQFAWRVLTAFGLPRCDLPDLVSEGLCGALRAVQRYDVTRFDVDFLTLASPQIRYRMVRYARAEKKRGGTGASGDERVESLPNRDDELLRAGCVVDAKPNFFESRACCAAGMAVLNARERMVVGKTLEGCSLSEIAGALNAAGEPLVSSNRIRQLQIRARTKIRRALQINVER